MTPQHELAALGAFYDIAVNSILATHGAALDRYAEWVLGRDDFALVTLGNAAALAALANPPASTRFGRSAARWPSAVTGIKLEAGRLREPTLYVRTVCPWDDGIRWLAGEVDAAVLARIPSARTLYGLGFQGSVIKTYALTPGGFVSYRVDGADLRRDHKEYEADVPWSAISWPDARWSAIGDLGRALGFTTAGHLGRCSEANDLKVYVERAGAIPTDRSLA